MTQPATALIRALRQSHDELADLVERSDAAALETPSGASEWSVAAVLSHLGSAAELSCATLAVGRSDAGAAPAVWARWNARSPIEQATEFVRADGQLVEALEALDDAALTTRQIALEFLPAPVDIAFFVGMRLSEVGLHRWDLEVAFDPSATVAAPLVPLMLDQLPAFAGFFAQPGGRTGRVSITTTDPAAAFTLDLGGDGATLAEGPADGAGTRISLPAEALLRLSAGRLGPDHTPASVTVTGDLTLDDLRQIFPGY